MKVLLTHDQEQTLHTRLSGWERKVKQALWISVTANPVLWELGLCVCVGVRVCSTGWDRLGRLQAIDSQEQSLLQYILSSLYSKNLLLSLSLAELHPSEAICAYLGRCLDKMRKLLKVSENRQSIKCREQYNS